MLVDTYTKVGHSGFNKDYVLAEEHPSRVIICDGCSSVLKTDVGARILAHMASNHIRYAKNYVVYPDRIINKAIVVSDSLGIQKEALSSTLAIIQPDRKIFTLYGDGVFFYKKKDGTIVIRVYDYCNGYPYYLVYKTFPIGMDEVFSTDSKSLNIKEITISDNNTFVEEATRSGGEIRETFNPKELDFVGFASDGISTFFREGNTERIDLVEFVVKMLDFKNTNGEFLKRRLGRMMRDYSKENVYNFDDFTVAVVNFKDEPENTR